MEGSETMIYYGALKIGRFFNTFYVYYNGFNAGDNTEHIVKTDFKTREEANTWIDQNTDLTEY